MMTDERLAEIEGRKVQSWHDGCGGHRYVELTEQERDDLIAEVRQMRKVLAGIESGPKFRCGDRVLVIAYGDDAPTETVDSVLCVSGGEWMYRCKGRLGLYFDHLEGSLEAAKEGKA